MQTVTNAASQIRELINHSRRVLVITRANTVDRVAAAISLAEIIRNAGHEVVLASPEKLEDNLTEIAGSELFNANLGPRSLVISLDYKPGSISKISYAEEGEKFNLVVTPANGTPFTPENVEYSYTGINYDLIITVGVPSVAELGSIFEAEKKNFETIPVVNIDCDSSNTQFGKVNAISTEATSVCEVVGKLVAATKLNLPKPAGERLLFGLRQTSANFNEATPSTFEAAAEISRLITAVPRETSEERLVNEPLQNTNGATEGVS